MLILCPIQNTVPNQQWRRDIPKTLLGMAYPVSNTECTPNQ